jgi:hypothetical protein
MIPATTTCPTSWTKEYAGYLMAELPSHKRNIVYECVDSNPESIPGSAGEDHVATLYFVVVSCGYGVPCPPYTSNKAITCVVCTK